MFWLLFVIDCVVVFVIGWLVSILEDIIEIFLLKDEDFFFDLVWNLFDFLFEFVEFVFFV